MSSLFETDGVAGVLETGGLFFDLVTGVFPFAMELELYFLERYGNLNSHSSFGFETWCFFSSFGLVLDATANKAVITDSIDEIYVQNIIRYNYTMRKRNIKSNMVQMLT